MHISKIDQQRTIRENAIVVNCCWVSLNEAGNVDPGRKRGLGYTTMRRNVVYNYLNEYLKMYNST